MSITITENELHVYAFCLVKERMARGKEHKQINVINENVFAAQVKSLRH